MGWCTFWLLYMNMCSWFCFVCCTVGLVISVFALFHFLSSLLPFQASPVVTTCIPFFGRSHECKVGFLYLKFCQRFARLHLGKSWRAGSFVHTWWLTFPTTWVGHEVVLFIGVTNYMQWKLQVISDRTEFQGSKNGTRPCESSYLKVYGVLTLVAREWSGP